MKKMHYPMLGEDVYTEKLNCGLTVCVLPRPEYSRTFAFLAANAGGMDTDWLENGQYQHVPEGTAHYIEHKLFDTPEGSALQLLTDRGAGVNAGTASSLTAFYFDCTEHFEENLRTLLGFVTTPLFTKESVEKERGIIAQEIRMLEDDPEFCCVQNLLSALYGTHPLRTGIPGTEESIKKITPAVLNRFHRAFYRPENMVLCVVGRVNPRSATEIARALVSIPKPLKIDRFLPTEESDFTAEDFTCVSMPVSAPLFQTGFRCTPPEQGAALRTLLLEELAAALVCGNASPLYDRLLRDGLIEEDFESVCAAEPGAAFLRFGGTSGEPEAVRTALLQEVLRLVWSGVEPGRFERAKKALRGRLLRRMNEPDELCESIARMHFLGERWTDFGEVLSSVTEEEVILFLRENLTSERSSLSVVLPE